jgi:TRAP-type mannitol/chloroaromatic compound transport system permease small subunit
MRPLITAIDQLNKMVGHAFAWCIVILTLGTSYEVFVRYVLNDPTSWAFDMSYILYGALFLMAGPYTLSRNAHVRGDIFYRLWRPVTQARLEFVLYFLFYFPGVLALVFYGFLYASDSIRVNEVSVYSPAGLPIWPLKMLIPIAGVLLTLQGVAELMRCLVCMREGQWPPRLHDVEELETVLARGETPAQVYLDPEAGVQKRGAKSE